MYEPWHAGSEVPRSADEAEVRALMRAVIGQAEASGVTRLMGYALRLSPR